jgi:hypothetical protein
VCGAVGWSVLQTLGVLIIDRQLQQANLIYGVFAVVIVLLSWLYLSAQLLLYAAEINVVLTRRLWPRSLLQPPLTEPDRRVLTALAETEERRPGRPSRCGSRQQTNHPPQDRHPATRERTDRTSDPRPANCPSARRDRRFCSSTAVFSPQASERLTPPVTIGSAWETSSAQRWGHPYSHGGGHMGPWKAPRVTSQPSETVRFCDNHRSPAIDRQQIHRPAYRR